MVTAKHISSKEVFSFAWTNWRKNWLAFFGIILSSFVLSYFDIPSWIDALTGGQYPDLITVIQMLWSVVQIALEAILTYAGLRYGLATARGASITFANAVSVRAKPVVNLMLANWLVSLLYMASCFPLAGVLISFAARGLFPSVSAWEQAAASDTADQFVALLTHIVISLSATDWLLLALGMLAWLVASVVVGVMFWAVGYTVVNEDKSPFEALKRSAELTQGVRGQLLWYGLYASLVMIAGALCFGVGLLVAMPIFIIASARVYSQLLGVSEPSAPPAPGA